MHSKNETYEQSRLYHVAASSDGKESACSVGDLSSISGLGRSPRGGHGNPLQHSCLENPHGERSLVGYSPWGHKESDMTEQLSTGHVIQGSTMKSIFLFCFVSIRKGKNTDFL